VEVHGKVRGTKKKKFQTEILGAVVCHPKTMELTPSKLANFPKGGTKVVSTKQLSASNKLPELQKRCSLSNLFQCNR